MTGVLCDTTGTGYEYISVASYRGEGHAHESKYPSIRYADHLRWPRLVVCSLRRGHPQGDVALQFLVRRHYRNGSMAHMKINTGAHTGEDERIERRLAYIQHLNRHPQKRRENETSHITGAVNVIQ